MIRDSKPEPAERLALIPDCLADESRLEDLRIPEDVRMVVFAKGQDTNESDLIRRLDHIGVCKSVIGVRVDWDSCLTTLDPIAKLFPEAKGLTIKGSRMRDLTAARALVHLQSLTIDTYKSKARSLSVVPSLGLQSLVVRVSKDDDVAQIAQCVNLRTLGLTGWPKADLLALQPLSPVELNIMGGKLQRLGGIATTNLRSVIVASCTKLKAVELGAAMELNIMACNQLDLMSLGGVRGLRKLKLQQKRLDTFVFLDACRDLEILEITATDIVAGDIDKIVDHPNLQKVWLCPRIRDDVIRKIGKARPNMTIANSRVRMVEGVEVSVC